MRAVPDYELILTKDFQESPKSKTTEDGDRQVVIPVPQVNELAASGNNAGNDAHDTESQWPSDRGGRRVAGPAQKTPDTVRKKIQATGEHKGTFWVIGEGANVRHEPTPEGRGRGNADSPGGHGSSQTLTGSEPRCVAAVETAESGRGCVAPAEKQYTHDANILGEESQDDICTKKVPNHTIVTGDLGLAHKSAQAARVELVDFLRTMADDICNCDRHQCGKEHGSDLQRLDTPAVKVEGQKPDRHVQ